MGDLDGVCVDMKNFITSISLIILGFFTATAVNSQELNCFEGRPFVTSIGELGYDLTFLGNFYDSPDGLLTYVNLETKNWVVVVTQGAYLCILAEGKEAEGVYDIWGIGQ